MTRTLPHSLDAEISVVGGILLHPRAFDEVAGLEPQDFYHPTHSAIYQAMIDLDSSSKPIDPITVAAQMRVTDTFRTLMAVHGESYFSELTSAVVGVENIAYHARIVRGKATVRSLIEAAQGIAARGYGEYGDTEEFIDDAERIIFEIAARNNTNRGPVHVRAGLRLLPELLEARRKAGGVVGVGSGLDGLDSILRGFQAGKLYVLAARPRMGKSALGMGFALHAAVKERVPVLFDSLEMTGVDSELGGGELLERMVSAFGSVDGDQIKSGFLHPLIPTTSRLVAAASDIAMSPIMVDDAPAQTIAEVRSKARRWRAREAAPPSKAILIVDYMQLMHGQNANGRRDQNREREVAEISAGLKSLSKELDCPIIALAQVNRECEKRIDKRPTLADLRESGSVEADADVVMFLYREHVYDPTKSQNEAELIVAKQRGGSEGVVKLHWSPQFTRFDNMSRREENS